MIFASVSFTSMGGNTIQSLEVPAVLYHEVEHAAGLLSFPSLVTIHAVPTEKPRLAMSVEGWFSSMSQFWNASGIPSSNEVAK
jgi:hypothetical protein